MPIVVAVNKVDKEGANPDKIRQQLTEYNLVAEEYGGDTMFVDVSAKQRHRHRRACSRRSCSPRTPRSTCGRTPTRTLAVSPSRPTSTRAAVPSRRCWCSPARSHVGDSIVAGTAYGRVRAMFDEHGEHRRRRRGPSRPVQVLGLTSVPRAGDTFLVAPDDRTARQIAEKREAAERAAIAGQASQARSASRTSRRRSSRARSRPSTSSSRATSPVPSRRWRTRCSRSTWATRSSCGSSTAASVRSRRTTSTWPPSTTPIIIGFNVAHGASGSSELAEREGVDIALLLGHLPGDRGRRGGAQGHAQAGVRGGAARLRRGPRGVPVLQVRQHRRFDRPVGDHPPQHARRALAARRRRGRRQPHDRVAASGSRTTPPRSARASSAVSASGRSTTSTSGDVIETFEMREKPRA